MQFNTSIKPKYALYPPSQQPHSFGSREYVRFADLLLELAILVRANMSMAVTWEATVDFLGLNHGVNFVILRQIGLIRLPP